MNKTQDIKETERSRNIDIHNIKVKYVTIYNKEEVQ